MHSFSDTALALCTAWVAHLRRESNSIFCPAGLDIDTSGVGASSSSSSLLAASW